MIKKTITAAAILTMFLSIGIYCSALAADSQPAIFIDGAGASANAQMIDGTVYLPLRAVCETLGYTVQWDGKNGGSIVSVSKAGEMIVIDLKNYKITTKGHAYYTGDCVLIDNHTYMQADLFSENFGFKAQQNQQTGAVELTRVTQNPITITTMNVFSDTDDLTITLQYPQINELSDSTVQDGINTVLRETAMNAENEGLQNAYELVKVKEDGYTGSPNMCETYFDYSVKYNQNGLLSLILMDYQYAGGAHGNTIQTAYTFDLQTGKVLALSDLMKNDSGYVSYINSAVRQGIDERVKAGNLYEFEDGKFQSIKDDQNYYLSNSGVVIYFQQYEYFPYVSGIQEFQIGFSDLKELLKTEYSFLYNEPIVPKPSGAASVSGK